MKKIILASASPRRRELLERADVNFEVIPASGEENRTSDNPKEAVGQLARDKAVSVMHTVENSADGTIVIGADTVVVFENMILGKPHDAEDAVNTIKNFRERLIRYTPVFLYGRRKPVSGQKTPFMRVQM